MSLAILDVQSGFNNTASTQLPAFAVNPSNGDLIVVGVSVFNRGAATVAVTDTAGNTYTRVGGPLLDNAGIPGTIALFYAQNITGGSTFRVTLTLSVLHGHAFAAFLITGAAVVAFNGDNVSASGATSTTPILLGPTTPAPPKQSIFFGSLYFAASGNAILPGAGWNVVGSNGFTAGMNTTASVNQYTNPFFASQYLIYKISTTAETATWTQTPGGSIQFLAYAASFSSGAASGGGGGVPWWATIEEGETMAQSYNQCTTVTPSNTVDLARPSEALWIGGAGDLAIVQGATTVTLVAVPAGSWLPLKAKRVNATGTTATNILSMNSV